MAIVSTEALQRLFKQPPTVNVRNILKRAAFRSGLRPNELRIVFDFATSIIALSIAIVFAWAFIPHSTIVLEREPLLFLPPLFQVGFNAMFGIYSRLWTSSGIVKVNTLMSAILCTLLVLLLSTGHHAIAFLWALLVTGPTLLPRILLNIQYSKKPALLQAMNHGGPVLVIGGAGYIGTHVVDLLLRKGFRVRVLDCLMYGRSSLESFQSNPKFEFVDGDATDISKLAAAFRGASAVVHLAGLVGDPACAVDADFTLHTNIVVTRMVKEVAKAMGVRRFIFASSCSVYGVSDTQVDELGNLNPVSLYAQSKIDSERELLNHVDNDFFVTILRFATVFGHSRRARFDLVGNLFTAQAFNQGLINVIGPQQWRPFVHVSDVARAIVTCLEADPIVVQNQIFNVGDDESNYTILQLAEIVKGVVSNYRPVNIAVADDTTDPRSYAVSFKKIRSTLGFRAKTSVKAGIEEMARQFITAKYGDYRTEQYSNVAMTKRAVERFHDPQQLTNLYAPLSFRSAAVPVEAAAAAPLPAERVVAKSSVIRDHIDAEEREVQRV